MTSLLTIEAYPSDRLIGCAAAEILASVLHYGTYSPGYPSLSFRTGEDPGVLFVIELWVIGPACSSFQRRERRDETGRNWSLLFYGTIRFFSTPPLNDACIARSNSAIGYASANSGFTSTFPLANASITFG